MAMWQTNTQSDAKASTMLLYIVRIAEDDPRMGSTKRNKVMYFAERDHFRRKGEPITEAVYQKQDHGQTLRRMLPIERLLVEDGSVEQYEANYHGHRVDRLRALREPDMSDFSEAEIDSIDRAIEEARGESATQIRARSHDDLGWQAVGVGDDISWELANARLPEVTDRVRDRAQKLAQNLAERLGS